jgi:hypothetical protein
MGEGGGGRVREGGMERRGEGTERTQTAVKSKKGRNEARATTVPCFPCFD